MEGTLADLCAGWAVGRGALHAGELQKRSEWRRKYNARFFVLTCDELAWFPAPRTNELTCSSWRFTAEGERRAITLHHQLSVGMKGDSLVIAGPGSAVIVKAASEAELHSWHASLTALVHGLRQDSRIARMYVRERASLFSSLAFAEHPHAGSRNHRERAVRKTFFSAARATARKNGLGALVSSNEEPLLLSLTSVPTAAAGWSNEQTSAFAEIMAAIADAGHPSLLPPIHAELLPSSSKLATVRPLLAAGSVKDLVARVHDPRLPYSAKYARLRGAADGSGTGGGAASSTGASGDANHGGGPAPQPLSASRLALFGRQILEGLRFLRACGVPAAHVHPGNLLVRRVAVPVGSPPDSGWTCLISEYELALVGSPSFADQAHLAVPRLHAASVSPFSIPRDVLAFGHVLYFMTTGAELTEAQLTLAVGARVPGPSFPGPAAAWALLERIFLPRKDVANGPTLVDLLADPFFSVALTRGTSGFAATATTPTFDGPRAVMLRASRRRYGATLTISPTSAEEGANRHSHGTASANGLGAWALDAATSPSNLQHQLLNPTPQLPAVVVLDEPPPAGGKKGKKKSSRSATYTFGMAGEASRLGLTLAEASEGRLIVSGVKPDSEAGALRVPAGGALLSINGVKLLGAGLSFDEVAQIIVTAPRPLLLRIQAPKGSERQSGGSADVDGAARSDALGHDAELHAGSSSNTLPAVEEPRAATPAGETAAVDVGDASSTPKLPTIPRKYASMLKACVPKRGVLECMGNDGYSAADAEAMLATWMLRRSYERSPALEAADPEAGDGGMDELALSLDQQLGVVDDS